MTRVAALYVDPKGVYSGLSDVEAWDEARDARLYPGPWPVVAHPPCARWSTMAHVVQAKGGPKVGDDGGCFESALACTRAWGGVLEHPAASGAWRAHHLPRPRPGRWIPAPCGGWVTQVSQVAYGHRAQKRTWLYFMGESPPLLDWSEPEAEIRCDWMSGTSGERLATPIPFRDLLLSMARSVRQEQVA